MAKSQGCFLSHIPQSLAFWVGLTLASYMSAVITGGWPAVKDLLSRLIRWHVKIIIGL